MPIKLIDVLKPYGFDEALPTKLVRHQRTTPPVEELCRNNWLEIYQGYQSKEKFHDVKQIVSFYGLSGNRAGFYGLYNVQRYNSASEGPTPASCAWSQKWKRNSLFFYDLQRAVRFDDLRDRLIINWPNPRNWIQKSVNNDVLEILPPGRKLAAFNDYLEFSLTYSELKDLFHNEPAHRDWLIPLGAVAGIYLILAQNSGHQYVGSAYGEGGIAGRWRNYAISGDGGNVLLKKLIESDSAYPEQFRFSVLQILPRTLARDEVFQRETIYKRKLGTRATGLNSN